MRRFPTHLFMVGSLILVCFCGPALGDDSKDGWLFTETVRNQGSRSEYVDTSLSYEGDELPGDYASVITPIGEFDWTSGGWPPTRAGYWVRSSNSQATFEDMEPQDQAWLDQGYYSADPGFRMADTPSHWFYSRPCGCWIDPARFVELLPLFDLEEPPASPMELEDQSDIVPEPMVIGGGSAPSEGSVLEQRMKAILAALNQDDQHWKDAMSQEDLLDPWGTPFEVERLTERDAGLQGYEYIVYSAGEDMHFGTPDDFALHDEVSQGFRPSPMLMMPDEEEFEEPEQ